MGWFKKTFKKVGKIASFGQFPGIGGGGIKNMVGGGGGGGGQQRMIPGAEGAWNALYENLQANQGPQGLFPEIMSRFPAGEGRHMQQWFKEAAPMLSTSLFGSSSYKFMQDQGNWDQSMQAYGAGAGMLGQAAKRGLGQGQNQLARMGLGRSGAQAALANQTQQALGGQQANMFTNLFQQSVQNRLQGAQQAFDLDRSIMQMAMGSTQMPPARQKSPGLGGAIGSAAGSAVGMGLGSLFAGGGSGTTAGVAGSAAGSPSFFAPFASA